MRRLAEIAAERRRAAAALAPEALSEVRPSIRDFAQYLTGRDTLSVVADLRRRDRFGRFEPAADRDLVALARVLDDAEVDAVSVATDPDLWGADLRDLARVSAACESLPVMRRDLVLDAAEVYRSRLHGADAVLLWPAFVEAAALREAVYAASTTHMTPVAQVWDEAGLDAAVAAGIGVLELSALGPDTGPRDPERVLWLAERAPGEATLLAAGGYGPATLPALAGRVDAVVLGSALLEAEDPAAVVHAVKSVV